MTLLNNTSKKNHKEKFIVILIFFFYLILVCTSFLKPMIIKGIMDEGMIVKKLKIIILLSIVLTIVVLIEEITEILQVRLFVNLKNRIIIRLYENVIYKLLHIKSDFFLQNDSAQIINQLSTDIEGIGKIVDVNIMNIIRYILQIISGTIGMMIINWKLAVLILLIIPLKCMTTCIIFKKEEKNFTLWIEELANFMAWLNDTINGIHVIKLWNLYKNKQSELRNKQKLVLEFSKRSELLQTYNFSSDAILQWTISILTYIGGGYMICNNQLSIGGMTAFIAYGNYVTAPISAVLNLSMTLAQVKPSIKRLRGFFSLESEKTGKRKILDFNKELCFKNVKFSHKDKTIIKNVNFSIHKGEKVAIIGDNGSGKTTLINLLLRFLNCDSGQILMDGINIQEYDLVDYRKMFSVVEQDIYLFKDSIGNNITLGKISEKEMIGKFGKLMHMQELIDRFSKGYDSIVENNGDNLSGGERQRIALMRAVVKDAPILILDEATSNIDKKYEKLWQSILYDYFYDKTIIVITHKMEHLKYMDKIYQIKNHTIKEYCDRQ